VSVAISNLPSATTFAATDAHERNTAGGAPSERETRTQSFTDGFATVGQLKFPATQLASSDANTLDDYEEGTWTPAIGASVASGSHTYSSQTGLYTKIGRAVLFHGSLIMTAKDAALSGNVRIESLPFTSFATANYLPAIAVAAYNNIDLNVASNYYQLSARMNNNTTVIPLFESGDNVASANITEADIANNSAISVGGVYFV
jgi:hypothetical protein